MSPRPSSGPRRIDQSGTWYAVKVINGKRQLISLGTKLKSEAMRRWPAAQAELEALAAPPKFKRGSAVTITEWDPDTGKSIEREEWVENLVRDDQLVDEEDSALTWAQAEDIAAKRYQRRKGTPVSRSWRYNIKNALRHLNVRYPLSVKPSDVRQMVDRMEEQGYKATTIAQRSSVLSGVIDALIKGGYTEDDHINPFDRVDTAAVGTSHFYKPTPEDYSLIWSRRKEMTPEAQITLDLLIITGARVGEILNGTYRDACLVIKETPDWRPKNRASQRVVPLPSDYKHPGIHVDAFRRQFNKIRGDSPITPHSFRHGFKTAAREAKADELTVERLLGHTIGKMAMTYGEYPIELLKEEANKVRTVVNRWRDTPAA